MKTPNYDVFHLVKRINWYAKEKKVREKTTPFKLLCNRQKNNEYLARLYLWMFNVEFGNFHVMGCNYESIFKESVFIQPSDLSSLIKNVSSSKRICS